VIRYSRERVDEILRPVRITAVYRILLKAFLSTPLALKPGRSRFCDGRSFAVLYAAGKFDTAFVETVVRDRFVQADRRVISLDEVRTRGCVEFVLPESESLRLVDLRDDGCLKLGAPTDAAHARNHSAGRALGRALYDDHDHVDGIWYRSRLTGGECFAIFDRAAAKLRVQRVQNLIDHPDLAVVLREHSVFLEE
jgi:hypothetical protein